MSTFSIQIDATQLVYRDFIIPGKTADWTNMGISASITPCLRTLSFKHSMV